MFAAVTPLKPLSSVELSAEETKILGWIRRAKWEKVPEAREPILKTKVPEFFDGVRLYRMQAGAGSLNAIEMLIKKLGFQGVIGKQEMYPLQVVGVARYLSLKKSELEHLGMGGDEGED